MLVDTHCHLDQLRQTSKTYLAQATDGVQHCVIPSVEPSNWASVREIARSSGNSYALGIHPFYAERSTPEDIEVVANAIDISDPHLVALGEIGLDFFTPDLRHPEAQKRQIWLYEAQLQLAQEFNLPVILHARRSLDLVLRGLRRYPVRSGIAHAFNGSLQQAQQLIDLEIKLGFGGALTYERATKLRQLAQKLPLDSLVLETDAPYMPPQWLEHGVQNTSAQLPRIAKLIADLRGISLEELGHATCISARAALRGLPVFRHELT